MTALVNKMRCLLMGHDPSWVTGVSLGYEHPVCRACGEERPVGALPTGPAAAAENFSATSPWNR